MGLVCNDNTFSVLQEYSRKSTEFLNLYRWISDAYVSDFFFKNHWDHLPETWQACLKDLTTEDLTFLVDRNKSTTSRTIPPLSLLCFKGCTQTYSLDRNCVEDFESTFQHLFPEQESVPDLNTWDHNGVILGQTSIKEHNKDDELHVFFKKHVKPKKRHEIQNLSKVINLLGGVSDCKCVIDVGSGLGHLSRILSFKYGLKVISVEAASSHAPKASKYDKDMEREVLKKKDKGEKSVLDYFHGDTSSLPCHLTRLIHPNTSTDEFMEAIRENQSSDSVQQTGTQDVAQNGDHLTLETEHKASQCSLKSYCKKRKVDKLCVRVGERDKHKADGDSGFENLQGKTPLLQSSSMKLSNESERQHEMSKDLTNTTNLACDCDSDSANDCITDKEDAKLEKFILTGLHACGDLTATFLRFFVNCPEAKGLASVGCCYMKLSDESCLLDTMGYPLSKYIRGAPNHQQSYAARELACHFADAYSQRLRDCPPHLRIHSYRAALEWIANQICPTFQRSAVQIPAKKTNNIDFEGYVRLGLEKLGLSQSDLTDTMLTTATEMTSRWKDVVAFYTIRLALAPVIETLILLDRMLFLYEHGHDSAVIPIFDPSLSPRNFVLLSWKR